jgi:hypothetical protein
MTLIIFMLLVVVFLAVGVRILEAGNRVALTIALLLAVVLGARLFTQPAVSRTGEDTVQAAAAETQESVSDSGVVASVRPAADAKNSDDAPEGVEDREPGENTAGEIPVDGDAGDTPTDSADDTRIRMTSATKHAGRNPAPDWLDSEEVRTGTADGIDTTTVCSDPFEHLGECRPALDAALEQAVSEYVDEYLGPVDGDKFQPSSVVHFDARYIRENLVGPEGIYEEKRDFSFGPMYQTHALIKFTPEFRQLLDVRRSEVEHRWQEMVVTVRLLASALAFGLVLAFLAVVTGYFRLDTATRGFYTGRLQFLAAVAILAVIVAGALLAKNVPWM